MSGKLVDKVLDQAGQGLAFLKPSVFDRKFSEMTRDERTIRFMQHNLSVLRTRQLLVPRVTKFIERAVGRERDRIVMLVKKSVEGEFQK